MSIGFVYLIIELLKAKHDDKNVYVSSLFNICAIALSTIGGVASLIGMFFSEIRGYNRISIYIAFWAKVSLCI